MADKNTIEARVLAKDKGFSLKVKPNPVTVILKYFILYLPLIIWALITFFPFWYMIVVSGLSRDKIFVYPPPMTIGHNFVDQFLANYHILLSKTPYWRNMWNSVYIASMVTLLSIFFCSLGGYGFAMYNFKGKNAMFGFMLFSLMIPPLLGLVPYYLMMRAFGWINTAKAIYVPGIANAFGIFMMRQFIQASIPIDLVDAARVDGGNEFSIYWQIVFPLIAPVIGSFGIITFLGSWNSYLAPLVIFSSEKTYTVPVALTTLRTMSTFEGDSMVATVIAVLPLLIVFILTSRLIITKVTEGALKG